MNREVIVNCVKSQHAFFLSGKTLSYRYRIENLKKLNKAIHAYEGRIIKALHEDLGKHPFESYTSEISIVKSEIHHLIKNLRKWMRSKAVSTPMASFGAKSKIYYQPKGVVLVMSPWNYPFQLTLAPVVAAMGAGNTVVIKPSSYSKSTSQVIEDMISEYFPQEYLCVFQGNRAINTMLLDQKFDHIFFTGSVKVGKIVMQAAANNLTPVTLELGGKSPCIIDSNVDIEMTAKRLVWGKCINSGQTCVAPDYVLVHKDVKEKLVMAIKKAKREFFGDDMLLSHSFGKIIRQQSFEQLIALMEGQNILEGGKHDESKLKIELTLLDNPSLDSPVMSQEIFGPILPIIPVDSMSHALEIIRKYQHPLALYLFTRSRDTERLFIDNVRFGGGCINDTIMHLANGNMPFGGIGESGMGNYHGINGFETFSHQKSILKQTFMFDVPVRYAPYSEKKLKTAKMLVK